jgi:hypothetical protein
VAAAEDVMITEITEVAAAVTLKRKDIN